MLQLTALGRAAQGVLASNQSFPPQWDDMSQLEKAADDWISRLLKERSRLARKSGPVDRFRDFIDGKIRTDMDEHLDDPDYPVRLKQKIVRSIHRANVFLFSYHRYIYNLTPLIHEVAAVQGRPARLLELASGSGELAMALARLAGKKKLPVEITGSDYIPEYVENSNSLAQKRGLPVTFREINAFDMKNINEGEFDIILISQSIHHFTPGQLAMMIAQAKEHATTALVGIDPFRSILYFTQVPFIPTLLMGDPRMFHDGWVTGRKLFTKYELELIARIAAPQARVCVNYNWPGINILNVRFD